MIKKSSFYEWVNSPNPFEFISLMTPSFGVKNDETTAIKLRSSLLSYLDSFNLMIEDKDILDLTIYLVDMPLHTDVKKANPTMVPVPFWYNVSTGYVEIPLVGRVYTLPNRAVQPQKVLNDLYQVSVYNESNLYLHNVAQDVHSLPYYFKVKDVHQTDDVDQAIWLNLVEEDFSTDALLQCMELKVLSTLLPVAFEGQLIYVYNKSKDIWFNICGELVLKDKYIDLGIKTTAIICVDDEDMAPYYSGTNWIIS